MSAAAAAMVPSPLALLLALGAAATALAEPLRFIDCGEWLRPAGQREERSSRRRWPGDPDSSLQVP